jgi:hypothetical protein
MKNKGTITKLQKTDPYDIAATQCWLEEMSAQGLHILRWGRLFCTFHAGEPKQVRYRLDPARPGDGAEPDAELRENYQQAGWRYVCSMRPHFFLFAADDPTVPELYTDADSMGYAIKHVVRWATTSLLAALILLLTWLADFVSMRSAKNIVVLFAVGFPIWLLCLLSYTHRFLVLFRAHRSLKQGKPLSAPPQNRVPIMTIINLALLVWLVCLGLFFINYGV